VHDAALWAATFVSAFLYLIRQIHSTELYLLFPLPANLMPALPHF